MDIGCGNGEFLLALSKYFTHNIDAKGIEPNVHKQQVAKDKGLNVGFYDLKTTSEKYDTISILNVYSHLPDPVEALQTAGFIETGGELIIETGDSSHLSYKDTISHFTCLTTSVLPTRNCYFHIKTNGLRGYCD